MDCLNYPDLGKTIRYCPECDAEASQKAAIAKAARELAKAQESLNLRLQNALLAPRFKDKTFKNYIIETDRQQAAVDTCRKFIEQFDKSVGMAFLGKTGTGKYHLAAAIINELIKNHSKTALFTEAIKIIRTIKESWRSDTEKESTALKQFLQPDLLVIDEIGVQWGSESERMYLTEICNDRYNWQKPVILIGNLSLKELREIMGDRVIDRLKEGGAIITFTWDSWRGRKKELPVETPHD